MYVIFLQLLHHSKANTRLQTVRQRLCTFPSEVKRNKYKSTSNLLFQSIKHCSDRQISSLTQLHTQRNHTEDTLVGSQRPFHPLTKWLSSHVRTGSVAYGGAL
jgi:hypothetical protein